LDPYNRYLKYGTGFGDYAAAPGSWEERSSTMPAVTELNLKRSRATSMMRTAGPDLVPVGQRHYNRRQVRVVAIAGARSSCQVTLGAMRSTNRTRVPAVCQLALSVCHHGRVWPSRPAQAIASSSRPPTRGADHPLFSHPPLTRCEIIYMMKKELIHGPGGWRSEVPGQFTAVEEED
jgi:hypothetical protein